jgi:hypothetical protein
MRVVVSCTVEHDSAPQPSAGRHPERLEVKGQVADDGVMDAFGAGAVELDVVGGPADAEAWSPIGGITLYRPGQNSSTLQDETIVDIAEAHSKSVGCSDAVRL